MNLNLKKPCKNCPFLKDGAIELAPGRLAGIIDGLTKDDGVNFQCHKTLHGKSGGQWDEDEDGNPFYEPSGNESLCVGSAIYMMKLGRPSVALRFAFYAKMISPEELMAHDDAIIEPEESSC
jgi:hypothetical protein